MIGKQIAHYRIVAKLGEGGMGLVYKARDTHLDRFVAIKVLPPERVADAGRKARFVQEAKAASALNHPNIITIYDISCEGGHDFIAMEYVAGTTLEQLIGHKGLTLNETLKYAIQIADALARAHAAGIIHRDLKPSNLMVDEHGLVKVLDFGLAKLAERHSDESAPTETLKPQTEEGVVVGTAGYMSPEQVEGKQLDARSDVFSFGAVLYEMFTGRRAFHGNSRMATMSAILNGEPAPVQDAPPELEKLITRCLRKDPERRAQHMADVKLALQELKEDSESGKLSRPLAGPLRKPGRWTPAIAAGAILSVAAVAGLALRLWKWQSPDAQAPLMRLTSDTGLTTDPALSSDGRLIAYASDRAGGDNLDIWVQQVDGGGSPLRLTTDMADESEPSFSPDGNRIVFRSERDGGGIYTVPALGGDPRLIVRGGHTARFSPDGSRIAFVTGVGGLVEITRGRLQVAPSTGGAPRELGDLGGSSPVWSPDGKNVLFATGVYRADDWAIVSSDPDAKAPPVVLRLDDLKKKERLADLVPYYWTAGNHILFSAKSGDSSHIFEIGLLPPGLISREWKLEASSRRLTSGTELAERPALAAGASPKDGYRLAFASHLRDESLWTLALDTNHPGIRGKLQRLTQGSSFLTFPCVSNDGTKVVYISHTAYNDEVWVLDLRTGKRLLLSTETSRKFKPLIHPDGLRVLYESVGKGIFTVPISGGPSQAVCSNCGWPWDWSRDSKQIVQYGRPKVSVVFQMVNVETGERKLYLEHPGTDLYEFRWSPDGRWIVFFVNTGTRGRVYVAPYSGDRGPSQDSWIPITDGAAYEDKLNWSPDGTWIYSASTRDGYLCIWAYPLDPQTKRPAGAPVAVFHSHGTHLSLRNADKPSSGVSVAKDKIVFNQGEVTGNIWMTEFRP